MVKPHIVLKLLTRYPLMLLGGERHNCVHILPKDVIHILQGLGFELNALPLHYLERKIACAFISHVRQSNQGRVKEIIKKSSSPTCWSDPIHEVGESFPCACHVVGFARSPVFLLPMHAGFTLSVFVVLQMTIQSCPAFTCRIESD